MIFSLKKWNKIRHNKDGWLHPGLGPNSIYIFRSGSQRTLKTFVSTKSFQWISEVILGNVMGQGAGGETAERKCTCLLFTQRVSGRKHQAMLPMTPSVRWLFLSEVRNRVRAVCLRSKRWDQLWDEFAYCQLFARGTYWSPLSASGMGSSAPSHSLSLSTPVAL